MNWFKKLTGKKEEGLKPGDWVNSYSKGIFRIERFIDRYFDESEQQIILPGYAVGDKNPQRIVVLKRLLNAKYGKSIGYESCAESLVSPITAEQKNGLDTMLKENPTLVNELDNYEIPVIEEIYNMKLQIDNKTDLQKVNDLIFFIQRGKTFSEIKEEMERQDILKLIPEFYGNYLFQLFNHDFEYHNKRKVWRDAKLSSTK